MPDFNYSLPVEFSARQQGGPGLATARASRPSFEVSMLSAGDEDEVLSSLSAKSLTNVIMSGFIRDNGLVNPLNRGFFYGCRDEQGKLQGIALIGHTILFEAFSEGAIQAFASFASRGASPHMLMGERNAVRRFWNYHAVNGESPRLLHPVLFMERHEPFAQQHSVAGLQQATHKDLEQVVRAQAAMAFETSGVDPLKKDPDGFRERYLRRIEQNRVWVLMKNGRLIFKTDVITEVEQAAYIEGVYVSPEARGMGLGGTCLQAVGRVLLEGTKAIYLFVEHENTRLQSFYTSLGFRIVAPYDLLYF